jgi:hypothetical protein
MSDEADADHRRVDADQQREQEKPYEFTPESWRKQTSRRGRQYRRIRGHIEGGGVLVSKDEVPSDGPNEVPNEVIATRPREPMRTGDASVDADQQREQEKTYEFTPISRRKQATGVDWQ